ncbi:NYN domain-containing protein [Lactovum miscens]|uniref:Uncharacterized LabA/DUF88 family protein n=1 Tax=Lactovum miscens TaxID=190387 RepID=A0A841C831_9LACT|nr:NYN domain-containing protein [Lactovum miscens]MBB5887711.1 uncharacterized LabA/DUF88 family protein [Lactovum miscens]
MKKVAILIDGGFYRKVSNKVMGPKSSSGRADELYSYCNRHLSDKNYGIKTYDELYRIFYYDCQPSDKVIYNPLTHENVDFLKLESSKWARDFFEELAHKRKVALRFGELSDGNAGYSINKDTTKALFNGHIKIEDLKQKNLSFSVQQKGVDMRIGLDIATLSLKHQVDKIILIAGDSDFVPAAKLARREGIDFVLDPLGHPIKDSLALHIDGLTSVDAKYKQGNW